MYTNNELLFPNYAIPLLRDMRGEAWRELVDRVASQADDHPERLAFVLMMVQLNGCMECETDSYRAMRGCAMCATQTLRRYKGKDDELLKAFALALADIEAHLAEQEQQRQVA